ncbi:stage V sporulation protein AB [Natroniella sp. ANB-PHB2]|uniref:stage V sporulation protein AB n=1 Tax=Natroniella sp. ANB-PHB2 TaxID=3384444 RepID=UPI0038D459BE
MRAFILILTGFAGGVVVGTALVAFLLVLDVIPRLIQVSDSKEYIKFYQVLVIVGPLLATNFQFYDWKLPFINIINTFLIIIMGFIFGVFIGLLAGALTEVLKVLPILSRRLGLQSYLGELLAVIILGKAIGSLIYWLFPTLWPP